jgi:hypothetical protein
VASEVFTGYGRPLNYNWLQAIPLTSATTNGVVKMLLDNINPGFRLTENIDSDLLSHFTPNTIRELVSH